MKNLMLLLATFLFLQFTQTEIKIEEISVSSVLNDNKTMVTAWGFGKSSDMGNAQTKARTEAISNLSKMVAGVDYTYKSDGFTHVMTGETDTKLKDVETKFMEVISNSPYQILQAMAMPSVPITFSSNNLGAFKSSFSLQDPQQFALDFDKAISESVQKFLVSKEITETDGKYVVHNVEMKKHKKKQIYNVELTIVLSY